MVSFGDAHREVSTHVTALPAPGAAPDLSRAAGVDLAGDRSAALPDASSCRKQGSADTHIYALAVMPFRYLAKKTKATGFPDSRHKARIAPIRALTRPEADLVADARRSAGSAHAAAEGYLAYGIRAGGRRPSRNLRLAGEGSG